MMGCAVSMDNEKYIGKVVLIGLTFVDENDKLIEQYQTHGLIASIDENHLMTIARTELPNFILPLNKEAMKDAKPGSYRERSSGIEIENPDFTTAWTVTSLSEERRAFQKQHGFGDFQKTE